MSQKKTTWKNLIHELGNRLNAVYDERFITENIIVRSWRMVLFISILAVFVVYSAHKVDQKVVIINELKIELRDLRSRHIEMRTNLMTLSKPINIAEEVKKQGLLYSSDAPFKIMKNH